MANEVKVEMTPDEWGQVLMVLQGGVYRVVAPIIMKLNNQLITEMQRQQTTAIANGPRLVEEPQGPEAAE